MRKIKLQGRLDIMSGLVGTLTNEDDLKQSVIIALLPESLSKKKLNEEKAKIRMQAEKHVLSLHGLEPERLTNLFGRLAQTQSTLDVREGQPAGKMIDFLLEDKATKNVIFCHDRTAYLEVCSELGVSRNDLLNIAELSGLLPEETKNKEPEMLIGRARHLCRELAAGNVPIFTNADKMHLFTLSPDRTERYIDTIIHAAKYNLGDFEHKTPFIVPEDSDRIYLPHNPTYLEYTILDSTFGINSRMYLLCEKGTALSTKDGIGDDGQSEDIVVSIFMESQGVLHLFPVVPVIKGGGEQTEAFLPHNSIYPEHLNVFRDEIQKMMAYGRVKPMIDVSDIVLAAFDKINEPRYQPRLTTEALTTKQKKIEKKEQRKNPKARKLPLFSYQQLNFNAQSQSVEDSENNTAPKKTSKSASQGLWEQPLHKRKEHRKLVHYGDGSKEKRIIDAYNAGNPLVGIRSRTEKRDLTFK